MARKTTFIDDDEPGQKPDTAPDEQRNDSATGEQASATTGTQGEPLSGGDDEEEKESEEDIKARYLEKGHPADIVALLERKLGGR
jgi:hypothetical protein